MVKIEDLFPEIDFPISIDELSKKLPKTKKGRPRKYSGSKADRKRKSRKAYNKKIAEKEGRKLRRKKGRPRKYKGNAKEREKQSRRAGYLKKMRDRK